MDSILLYKKDVIENLARIIGAVDRKQIHPMLTFCLVALNENMVKVIASDLEIQVEAFGALTHSYFNEQKVMAIPAKKFFDFCRVLPEEAEIKINLDEKRVKIQSSGSTLDLSSFDTSHFPLFEHQDFQDKITLNQKDLKATLENISFAMAHTDIRYYLNGIYIIVENDEVVVVATDGHRLATSTFQLSAKRQIEKKVSAIIPRRAILELIKILEMKDEDIDVEIYDQSLLVRKQDTLFHCKLIDGKFPDYKRVMPKEAPYYVEIDREELRSKLLQVLPILSSKDKAGLVLFSEKQIKIKASNAENEQIVATLQAEGLCPETEIGFNLSYLLDYVNIVKMKKIKIRFKDENNGVLFSQNSASFYLVMPLKF